MSLSSKTELARALFRSTPPDSVTRISGTATADSSDGTVTVQLEDGDVIEVGTIGSVSAGDTVTIHVQRGEAQVIASEGWGDAMQAAVDEATAIAEATGQHFWHDSNGAHVTEVTADQWAQSQTGHNILINSLGILLRRALNYIAAWTGSALSFYDGNGNAASNVTASFGSSGAQVGKVGESHLEMDYRSLRMIDKEGDEYFEVEDLRDSTGRASIAEIYTLYFPSAPSGFVQNLISLNLVPVSGSCSFTVTDSGGNDVTSDFTFAVSYGGTVTVTGPSSYVGQKLSMKVSYDTESPLAKSYTAGIRHPSMAKGPMSFAEGHTTAAESPYSHAEGNLTEAIGTASHAEGYHTRTTDHFAHAEGYDTVAGYAAHAQNQGTIARGDSQTAIGRYNVADSTSALIIGNGADGGNRSNALTVDWSGNVDAAGDVRAGGSTPLVPIGTILDFAAATAPTGYLVCDGSAVSRTTYAALFAVIGTTWGSGNGSTTFNIPDFRGRTAIGAGTGTASDATAHALGSNGGTETHKLTHAQSGVPAHNHPLPNSAIVYNADGTQRLATSGSGTKSSVNTNVGLSTASNTAADASSAHPNMQPYAAVTKIIRAI